MILVNYVEVIKEESQYLFFCKTQEGMFSSLIPQEIAFRAYEILNGHKTLVAHIMSKDLLETMSCEIFLDNFELKSRIIKGKEVHDGPFAEGVLLAMELEIPIYLKKDLLEYDYLLTKENEKLVQDLLREQIEQEYCNNLDQLLEQEKEAVNQERYEDAAVIRDRIQMINSNIIKDMLQDKNGI